MGEVPLQGALEDAELETLMLAYALKSIDSVPSAYNKVKVGRDPLSGDATTL